MNSRIELNKDKQKVIDREKQTERVKKVVKRIVISIIIIFLLVFFTFLYITTIGTTSLMVNEEAIVNQKIPESFSGLKVIQFGDLHYSNNDLLKDVVNAITKRNPDLILFTGDLLGDEDLTPGNRKKLVKELESMYQELRKTNDRAEFEGFDSALSKLTSDQMFHVQNREITRLVGYCLVELCRFVDETELSDATSKEIWNLILQNLKTLESPSKTENYRRSFEMLEKIYQTALLKIAVSFGGEDNDVPLSLFQTIIHIVDAYSGLPTPSKRPSKSKKGESTSEDTQFTEEELQTELERIRGIIIQIMIAVIDLYRKIPYSLLDIILSNTIGEDENPVPAHIQLLTDLLSVKKAKLAPSVQKLITDIMVGSSVSTDD